MRWVAVWVVLVLGASAYLALIGRWLWRRAKAVFAEYEQASSLLQQAAEAGQNVTFRSTEPILPILDGSIDGTADQIPWSGQERRRTDRRSTRQPGRAGARHRAGQG